MQELFPEEKEETQSQRMETTNHPSGSVGGEAVVEKKNEENDMVEIHLADEHKSHLAAQTTAATTLDALSTRNHHDTQAAILHVYNYAARFNDIPEFFCQPREGELLTVTVRLDKLELEASAQSRYRYEAEALACINLKTKIEEQHSKLDRRKINLRDGTALNLDNARHFLRFYVSQNPGVKTKFVSAKLNVGSDRQKYMGQTSLQDGKSFKQVFMTHLKDARACASLVAAVELVSETPSLLPAFLEWLDGPRESEPRQILAIDSHLDQATQTLLDTSLESVKSLRLRTGTIWFPESDVIPPTNRLVHDRSPNESLMQSSRERSAQLMAWQEARLRDPQFQDAAAQLAQTPIMQEKSNILSLVGNNIHSVIIGSTGSGKSTIVPQIILNDAIAAGRGASCNIICTQPRRVAAMALARHVASFRQEPMGETVGYSVGGDELLCKAGGSITYCTAEVLSNQLESRADAVMGSTSHIVIDEIHIRDPCHDKLLATIKLILSRRIARGQSVPRIVLMSATLFSDLYAAYFELTNESGQSILPPSITVSGQMHPVQSRHLNEIMEELKNTYSERELSKIKRDKQTEKLLRAEESFEKSASEQSLTSEASDTVKDPIDWRSRNEIERADDPGVMSPHLVAATISHVLQSNPTGSILTFVPGWSEMTKIEKLLRSPDSGVAIPNDVEILLVHSFNARELEYATVPPAPGQRRVLLATDVAELALTFTDVKHVIDTGKRRVAELDENRDVVPLSREWISRSSMIQRFGRLGRVQSGDYYGLYSESRIKNFKDVTSSSGLVPGSIQQLCLRERVRFPEITIKDYFANWLEPPPLAHIHKAIADLQEMDALTKEQELTRYGRLLSEFATTPANVRMLVLATAFGCLKPMLPLADLRRQNSFFVPSPGVTNVVDVYADGTGSDHIAYSNAFGDLLRVHDVLGREKAEEYAEQQALHFFAFEHQANSVSRLYSQLHRLRFSPNHATANVRNDQYHLIKAMVLASHPSNLTVHSRAFRFHTAQGPDVHLHSESALAPRTWDPTHWRPNALNGALACYTNLYSTKNNRAEQLFMFEATPITPLTAVLFGQTLEMQPGTDDTLLVNGWIPIRLGSSAAPLASADAAEFARTLLEFRALWDTVADAACRGYATRRRKNEHLVGDPRPLRRMVEPIADLLAHEAWVLGGSKGAPPHTSINQKSVEAFDAAALWDSDFRSSEGGRALERLSQRGYS